MDLETGVTCKIVPFGAHYQVSCSECGEVSACVDWDSAEFLIRLHVLFLHNELFKKNLIIFDKSDLIPTDSEDEA